MAEQMKIEYINPFLVAGTSVLSDMCGLKLTAGKPYVKTTSFDSDYIVISLGVTGQIAGQVLLAFHNDVACDIASKMCMMPITALDELSLSALSELGNMILGNAATVLSTKGIFIDITPPSIIQGTFHIGSSFAQNICVPLIYDNDKMLKRAGLDYWDKLDVRIYDDFDDFLAKNPGAKIYMATTKAARSYTDVQYEDDCYIMFGKESAGIPESILQKYQDTAVRIPMWGDIRSLNLSNSVAIVLYEALRQNNFLGLKMKGRPRTFDWD